MKPKEEAFGDATFTAHHIGTEYVMIADDDKHMRALLATLLADLGHSVVECRSGVDELMYLRASMDDPVLFPQPDLIISDDRMPGLTGMELLQYASGLHVQIPIIIITAFGSQWLHQHALDLGAEAVLDKPFDFDELLMHVRRILRPEATPI